MIIIDDVIVPPPTSEQKASMLRLYQEHLRFDYLNVLGISNYNHNFGVANTAEL